MAIQAALYIATAFLSNIIANNAAAALLFPIVLDVSKKQGIRLDLLAFLLMFGASSAFTTPYGYQTNMMVQDVGGYKPMHYARFGGPMQVWLPLIPLTTDHMCALSIRPAGGAPSFASLHHVCPHTCLRCLLLLLFSAASLSCYLFFPSLVLLSSFCPSPCSDLWRTVECFPNTWCTTQIWQGVATVAIMAVPQYWYITWIVVGGLSAIVFLPHLMSVPKVLKFKRHAAKEDTQMVDTPAGRKALASDYQLGDNAAQ